MPEMDQMDETLLAVMSNSDINQTRSSLLAANSIIKQTQGLISTFDMSEERRVEITNKIIELDRVYRTIDDRIKQINSILQNQLSSFINSNNDQQITIDEWIANTNFASYNEDIKIKKIEVFETNANIVGLKLIMKNGSIKKKGNTNELLAPNIPKTVIEFDDGELLTTVKIKTSSEVRGLCKQIIFYTNLSGTLPYAQVPANTINTTDNLKIYEFKSNHMTWNQHREAAERLGYKLVCINNAEENEKVKSIARSAIWIGLFHDNNESKQPSGGSTDGNSPKWTWVDGSTFSFHNWNGNEPNNCCAGEPVVNMWNNGKWNDHNVNQRYPAVYQKEITNRNDTIGDAVGLQIVDILFNPFDGISRQIYKIDQTAMAAAQNVSDNVTNANNILFDSNNLLNEIKTIFESSKVDLLANMDALKDLIYKLDDSNRIGEQAEISYNNYINTYGSSQGRSGFSNMENSSNINVFQKIIDFFYPNIIEGATGMDSVRPSKFTRGTNSITGEARRNMSNTIDKLDNLQDVQIKNAFSEFLSKKDFVFSSVLTDYMINNEDDTDISKLYEKVKQDNDNKHRQMGINTYYNKAYKEYINMIKVVIFVTIILIPVLLLNKNELIPKNITLFIIVAAVFLTSLYLIYKFYDLYMRDTKNFDKIKIPYDRTAQKLISSGDLKDKTLSGTFGITCIGDECCDGSMVYDNLSNKCVIKTNDITSNQFNNIDGFTNFFENKIQEQFNNKIAIVEPFSSQTNMTNSLIESLSASDGNNFNKNILTHTVV